MQTVDQAVRIGPDRDVIDADRLHVWAQRMRELRAWEEHYRPGLDEDRRDAAIELSRIRRREAWLMAGRLCRPHCPHHPSCGSAGAAVFCDRPGRSNASPALLRMRCSAQGCHAWADSGDIYCSRCLEEIEARSWEQPRNLDRGLWAFLAAAATTIIVLAGLLAGCVR